MPYAALSVISDPLSSITNLLLVLPIAIASAGLMVLFGYWLSRDRD
jgi:hypothetical protein